MFLSVFNLVCKTPVYAYILQKTIDGHLQYIAENRKYCVLIETTNHCNAQCSFCPHMNMTREKEMMSEEVFLTLLNRLKEDAINPYAFILNGLGEPLIDKSLFQRIRLLKSKFPSAPLKIHSNFALATDAVIDEICSSGLDELHISFNGFVREVYEHTMKISYDRTISNILKLLEARGQKRSGLKVRISLTVTSENRSSVEYFIKEWEDRVDSVVINRVFNWGDRIDAAERLRIHDLNPPPCLPLFNSINVLVSGDIALCCIDYEGEFKLGNILEHRILNIFNTSLVRDIRTLHLKRKGRQVDICSKCDYDRYNGAQWFVRDAY